MRISSSRAALMQGAAVLLLALPFQASAEVVVQAVSLFNIFVGLMLVAALLTYGLGFTMWITRLGTWPSNRTEGIKVMEWAVVILFVLVVILMIVQFFRDHPTTATYVVAVLVLALVGWGLLTFIKKSGEKKEEE